MTYTQQIIQDAIEGEWTFNVLEPLNFTIDEIDGDNVTFIAPGGTEDFPNQLETLVQYLFLDPLFWQAVGKTRGWGDVDVNGEYQYPEARNKWHQFIDHLADGNDYETALSEIV